MSLSLIQQYMMAHSSYDGPGQLRPEDIPFVQTRENGARFPMHFDIPRVAVRQPPIDQVQTRLHFLVTDPQDSSLMSLNFEVNLEGLFDKMVDLIMMRRFFGHDWSLGVVPYIVTICRDPHSGSQTEKRSVYILLSKIHFLQMVCSMDHRTEVFQSFSPIKR